MENQNHDQDNNRTGSYNDDAGVIPEEIKGSDADTDKDESTGGTAI